MKIYFVRHGRTEWNEEGRFQGSNGDSPLLPSSVHQLQQLGTYLESIVFDAAYSSDLPRAVQTAELILAASQHPVPLETTPVLREWNLGKLEGAKIATISSIYPHQMDAFRHNLARFDHDSFDAESVYETTKRTGDFVKELAQKQLDTVLIVGHGANLTASIRTLLGYEAGELRQAGGLANGSVTILSTENGKQFELVKWNDTSYLDKEKH